MSNEAVQLQRERALEAALRLFSEQGLEAISVRAVASELQLSPMALYRYFPGGKREVLTAVRGSGFESLAKRFEDCIAGLADPIDQLLALTVALVRFALEQPARYRLMFDFTEPAEGEAYIASRRARAWRYPADALARAIAGGTLQGDPAVLPHLVFAGVHGALVFELSAQPHVLRRANRLLAPLLELLLRGAGADEVVLRKVRRRLARERL